MYGLQTLTNIDNPKQRSVITPDYTYTAIAKTVGTHTTEVGWAVYRSYASTTSSGIDWAQVNGVPTAEFVFTAIGFENLIFDEVA